MCLSETYSTVRIGKLQSDKFPHSEWPETWRCFITITIHLCFGIRHSEGSREPGRAEIKWDTPVLAYADDVNIVGENIDTIKKNTEALLDASKEVGLEVNPEKTKYMLT
jgi:hypothetical protein